jgi:hypothetical protein
VRVRHGFVVLGAWLLAAAPASAVETVAVGEAVARDCAAKLHEPGAPGVTSRPWTAPATGVLRAKLDGGYQPDWDLAVFRAGRPAAVAASSSFTSLEQVSLWVLPGQSFTLQACRRSGSQAAVPLAVDFYETALPVPSGERFSLESVAIDGPDDLARLEMLDLDVTHDVTADAATVALYSATDRAKLAAAGYETTTLIPDLAAADARDRAAEALAARVGARSALPTGRETYRVWDDYMSEMQQLAEENPGIVKPLALGTTLEGNPILGLEIAADVHRVDDGRPVYMNLGVHHAREWPSGELPMEFAHDLVRGYGTDPRITSLLERVRTIVIPVVNVDGFIVSRSLGTTTPADDNSNATLGAIATDTAGYKRKNCRAPTPELQAVPCIARPTVFGVDPNRNYGAYWGGAGTSTDPTTQQYRGTAPFSEPEPEAIHALSSSVHPTVVISNHTFTARGEWLYQPGFLAPGVVEEPVPAQAEMADLAQDMADVSGWIARQSYKLSHITGATEDWNYFAQGAYGYTPEAKGSNFHANYATMVVAEYPGVFEAFLLAGERAANAADHAVLEGEAPAGATLRLMKAFQTPTCRPTCQAPTQFVDEFIDTTLTVPADGAYEWHVAPSTRPLALTTEHWTMTCQVAGEEPSTTTVSVARGERLTPEWTSGSCAPKDEPNEPPVASFSYAPSKPRTGQPVTFTSTSADPENAIALHEWDLDDDGEFDDASGATVLWNFAAAGPRDVSLRVTDGGGATDVVTRRLLVRGGR